MVLKVYFYFPIDKKLVTMLSCNVRGFCDNLKQKTILNKFYSAKYDIILLQETHSTPGIEKKWNKNGQAYYYTTMGKIMLETQWLPLNHTSSLLYIILFIIIKVDILFLTAQFLNIDLHLSIYMDLILMNKPPPFMKMYSVKYMHHPVIPTL